MSESTYDNNNSGALFKNERRISERSPEYTGSANIDGKDFWISAWVNTAEKTGKKFFSLKFSEKISEGAVSVTQPEEQDNDEEIPF